MKRETMKDPLAKHVSETCLIAREYQLDRKPDPRKVQRQFNATADGFARAAQFALDDGNAAKANEAKLNEARYRRLAEDCL